MAARVPGAAPASMAAPSAAAANSTAVFLPMICVYCASVASGSPARASCSTSPSAMVFVVSDSRRRMSHVADADQHLEGAAIDEVAHQHAGRVAPVGIGGGAPAPQRRDVDHVVVQQRGRVQELDDRGQLHVLLPGVAQRAGAQQGDQRAHALAAALDDVLPDALDQRHVGVQPLDDQPVDGGEIVPDGG